MTNRFKGQIWYTEFLRAMDQCCNPRGGSDQKHPKEKEMQDGKVIV